MTHLNLEIKKNYYINGKLGQGIKAKKIYQIEIQKLYKIFCQTSLVYELDRSGRPKIDPNEVI